MGWSALGTQFCLELGFGVLVALAFVPRAPVGTLFYRIMGTCAFLPILIAVVASIARGRASVGDPAVMAGSLAVLAYPVVSGPIKGRRWAVALSWSLAWTAAALVVVVARAAQLHGAGEVLLGSLMAMATGAVAGSVSLAMVLGHWYLTIPTLDVLHLRRLHPVTAASPLGCPPLPAIPCAHFFRPLDSAVATPLRPSSRVHLGARLACGMALTPR